MAAPSQRRARRRRADSKRGRRIVATVFVVVGVVLLFFAAAAYRASSISNDLTAARDQLNIGERDLHQAGPALARAAVAKASAKVVHANSTLYSSPELSLLRAVPVLRQNIRALQDSLAVALRLTAGANQILTTAKPLESPDGRFEVPLRTGGVPLSVIRALRPEVSSFGDSLPRAVPSTSHFVLAPVRKLRLAIYRQAVRRQQQAASISSGLGLLEDLSGGNGDRRYLIAVANAAEMRGTGGMILAYGELTSKDGTFSLEHFGGINELQSQMKGAVPAPKDVPPDYLARFADLQPGLNFRNANLTGDFRYAGPLLEAMYRQATGKSVDGVIQIDSMGLGAMLKGIGPVDVAGLGRIGPANVVSATLSDAYARFPDERSERQEVLGDVAQAVFKKLVAGNYPTLRPLAASLVDAVMSRQIELHMARVPEQQDVTALGADGRLPDVGPDFTAFTLQNFAANKMDYYIDSAVSVRAVRHPASLGTATVQVTLHNILAPGQTKPVYVVGPAAPTLQPGEYQGLASLYFPQGTSLRSSSGNLGAGAAGLASEGGRSVISIPVTIEAAQELTITLEVSLPPGAGSGFAWVLLPQSRVRPTTYDLTVDRGGRRAAVHYVAPLTKVVILRDR